MRCKAARKFLPYFGHQVGVVFITPFPFDFLLLVYLSALQVCAYNLLRVAIDASTVQVAAAARCPLPLYFAIGRSTANLGPFNPIPCERPGPSSISLPLVDSVVEATAPERAEGCLLSFAESRTLM